MSVSNCAIPRFVFLWQCLTIKHILIIPVESAFSLLFSAEIQAANITKNLQCYTSKLAAKKLHGNFEVVQRQILPSPAESSHAQT